MTQSPTKPLDELGKLPPLPRPSKPPTYFTFYSFKGGVGRSMALINCAAILAGRGFRVLAMDLDLEAPGISYFEAEKEEDRQQPGFIDILHDAIELGVDAPFADDDPEKAIRHYIRAAEVPANLRAFDDGELYIMPAGKLDGDYEKRRHRVNIPKLYESGRGRPLVQLLRQRINDSRLFDFVLIDSRTGFSDEAGICIRDLGEHLVMFLGLNRQNAFGTTRFLEQLKKANIEPKSIDFVLSPVPTGEDNLFNQRRDEVADLLRAALGKKPPLDLEIPYHPRLALIETSHQFGLRHDQLYKAYHRLEERLRHLCGMTSHELFWQAKATIAEDNHDKSLTIISQLLRIDKKLAESALWKAASRHSRDSTSEPYLHQLLRNSPGNAEALWEYAIFLQYARTDYDGADKYFKLAIEAGEDSANFFGAYANFLTDYRRDFKCAEEFFCKSIARSPNEANHKANYSKMLFALGRSDEASEYMHLAWRDFSEADENSIRLELCFYAYAHQATPPPDQPLPRMKALLLAGTRSPGWRLAANVERAVADGHPEPEFLAALAAVVADEKPIESLDAFAVWRDTAAYSG